MNSLPPLRTVQSTATPPPVESPLTNTPAPRPVPVPEFSQLPPGARGFVTELVTASVLSAAAVPEFVAKLGERARLLSSRERTADALVGLGFLTTYQASRMLACQPHGLIFGGYRVRERIGSGSVGVVFRAEHPHLGRRAAVKVVSADESTPRSVYDRFHAEMRMLAAVDHPHVATVYDAGVLAAPSADQAALAYLVLEYVAGGDLEHYVMAHGPQAVGLACEWGRQVAAALRATHAAGLVHRDVKPSNLLLTESRRMKLIDFGLVRQFSSVQTDTRSLVGSLEFLAPEQLADAATAGPPADVYGLGATLFWVLTGHTPFPTARSAAEAVRLMRSGTPRKAREFLPHLPKPLDELLTRMLARNPADRPTLAAVGEELAKLAVPSAHPSQDDTPLILDDETEIASLRASVLELENLVESKRREAEAARAAVISAFAIALHARPGHSPELAARYTAYARALAPALARHPDWPMMADPAAVNDVARSVAALDLGDLGVGDEIDVESHTLRGSALLDELGAEHGPALPFLRVLRAAVRNHHERWDGQGFPDRLAGELIPLAARIAALVDGYDLLRRGTAVQPGGRHQDAVRQIARQAGTAFDPVLVEAFRASEAEFARIYRLSTGEVELPDAVEGMKAGA